MSATLDGSRLSESDVYRIRYAIDATFVQWRDDTGRWATHVDATARMALERIACHAIGCTVDDMRDSELEVIDTEIGAALVRGRAVKRCTYCGDRPCRSSAWTSNGADVARFDRLHS